MTTSRFSVWWIAAFALSFFCCVSLIYSMWLKWLDHPVLISFNREQLPISVVPLPAMTICSLVKTDVDIFDYSNVYRRMTQLNGTETPTPNQTE